MLRNKLVRSDGSVIDSSVIISCEFTEDVNSSTNLTVGDVTSSELSIEIRSTEAIQQGEVLTYYMVEDGVETLIGEFIAEKPTVASRTSIRFSAYDNIAKTEKVFSGWLRDNQASFPMTLLSLVQSACDYCGVTLATTDFPKHDLSVGAVYADNLTCRQILSWAGAIAGRFIRVNASGEIEFAWYKSAPLFAITPGESADANNLEITNDGQGNISIASDDMTVTDDGEGNVVVEIANVTITEKDGHVTISTLAIPYMSGGLSYETYVTDTIQQVQIKHSDDDIGVIYPQEADGNCFSIAGNMILGTCSPDDVASVAEHLYSQLCSISYVPLSIKTFKTIRVRAGDIITVRDSNGSKMTTYVMRVSVSPSGTTITSTGDKSYGSTAAVATEKYSNLTGKVLEISKTIDGLKVTNKSLDGRVGSLEVSTEAFQVEIRDDVKGLSSKIEETAGQVNIVVEEVKGDKESYRVKGTNYSFGTNGLDIRQDGDPMHNTVDQKGMLVKRDSEIILEATSEGVNAINLTARVYLNVGENARFEDYNSGTGRGRTACFYRGG